MPADTNPTTATLTISDLCEALTSEWRIVNSTEARVTLDDGRRGLIYWDDLDAANEGWAYQVTDDESGGDESGELNSLADVVNVFA